MAFSNTDTFLRTTLDAIGALAQKEESLREINLRLSISRQDISWRINAADDYAHDFQRLSTTPVTEGRYYQETKALFGFFTSALSALECFFYAA
jgi:translation initiation factor IF-3